MSDAFFLIRSLVKEGKNASEIARDLHARGVKTAAGKTLSPDMVSGFLRFIGGSADTNSLPPMFAAIDGDTTWGWKKQSGESQFNGQLTETPKTKRKNRWNPSKGLPDELKAKVMRLYQHEGKKVDEIAEELDIHPRKISAFCAVLSGRDVPPGEITTYVDSNGLTVSKCPSAFAYGAYPQRSVGAKGGS